jgi:hypothetical protein
MSSYTSLVASQVVSALTKATSNGKSWSNSTRNCSRQGLPENPRLAYKLIIELLVKVFKQRKRLKSKVQRINTKK